MCYYLCSEELNPSEESEDCAFYRLFFLLLAFYYLYLHLTMAYSILLKWVMNCSSSNCIMPVLYQHCLLISILHFFFWKHPNILLPSFSQSNSCFLSPIVIVWIIRGFPPNRPTPNRIAGWHDSPEGTKEMWRLMISIPQGELHVGFSPCCFQEGISKCIVIAAALCSTSSSLVSTKKKKKNSSGISAPDGSHLNLIHIILTTSTNWLPCFTQINMLQSAFKTFQRRATKHACHLTFPIHISLHNIG